MKWTTLFLAALVVCSVASVDARSKHKAKAKYLSQADYVAIANGQGSAVPPEVLKQFATPPAPLRAAPNPYKLAAAEHTFGAALDQTASMRFAQTGSGSGSGAAASGSGLEGVTTREEAEEKCAQMASLGESGSEETAGATPEAQMGEDAAGTGTGEKIQLPADQPAIQMPDGRRLPLPPGCDPTAPGATSNGPLSQEILPESERIPPGEGPCQACEPGAPQEPVKEIQILEWAPGKNQPLVLGKQLLTHNKTQLMLKVFNGEFDKELAAERKEQENYNAEVNKANEEMKEEAVEYAGALLKSQELSQNQMVEQALQEALGVWGLEMSYGKAEPTPDAGEALAEEELAAETVKEAEASA